jgi:hypothetical protein
MSTNKCGFDIGPFFGAAQLAQFGLTLKSTRGLAASEAVDPLDGV